MRDLLESYFLITFSVYALLIIKEGVSFYNRHLIIIYFICLFLANGLI